MANKSEVVRGWLSRYLFQNCQGMDRAIPVRDLRDKCRERYPTWRLFTGESAIRKQINLLFMEDDKPIICHPRKGAFWAVKKEEFIPAEISTIKHVRARMEKLRKMTGKYEGICRQMMEIEEGLGHQLDLWS